MLGYMEPLLSYTTLMLSYMRLMLRYMVLMSGYIRPLLSYTRRLLPHVEVHRALGNHRKPRDISQVKVQRLSKQQYIDEHSSIY